MAFCDFAIRYNPDIDTKEDLTKRIIYSVFVKRIKNNKPCVIFLGGDSGEGKSLAALSLMQNILEVQGLDIRKYLNDVNIYIPTEYPDKLNNLLHNPELKKVNVLCMHEARTIIKAKLWYSFISQSVADINALQRSVKRLLTIVISQFIRDITNDTRYTINYYCIVRRPKQRKARLYINVLWKDDRDLEKPKLRKRKLSGYLIYPNGKYRRFIPQYIEMSLPPKDIVNEFETKDREAKSAIIKDKLSKLLKEMNADIGTTSNKINLMVEYYTTNKENLTTIGKQRRGKWKLHNKFRDMHDLTKAEAIEFETRLNEKLKEIEGVING